MTPLEHTLATDLLAHTDVDVVPHWRSFAADLPDNRVLWSEVLPGGSHWSWRLSRGTALRFAALGERANCSVLLYAAHDQLERYSMPDTCKALHTAHFTRGHVLMSDMGRAMASITHDTLGWHDRLRRFARRCAAAREAWRAALRDAPQRDVPREP